MTDCSPHIADNPAMQARLARETLEAVLQALRKHRDTPEVAAKALVLLGVLAQVRVCMVSKALGIYLEYETDVSG